MRKCCCWRNGVLVEKNCISVDISRSDLSRTLMMNDNPFVVVYLIVMVVVVLVCRPMASIYNPLMWLCGCTWKTWLNENPITQKWGESDMMLMCCS
uniref:ORF1 n=1 Tax=Sida yellow mosaic China satellite DNA beta TaxID=291270 RepID=A0A4D5YFZ4_9VIRU|nr:ORF1 [Sida yellow mosaic China satellite DNA beta]